MPEISKAKADEIPKLWPEGCKLLIEVDQADARTAGGIIVPYQAREAEQLRLYLGTVLRIGPQASTKFADGRVLEVGSRVIFSRFGGYKLKEIETNRDLRIINDEDVLALIEDTWV